MGLAKLFEFVSLPERKTFSRRELARCLGKFGYFYHLLVENAGSIRSRDDLRTLTNLVSEVEEVCHIDLSDIKPMLDEAYRDYLAGKSEEAGLKVLRAMGKVRDSLAIFGEYV